jgi:hypothetical protein
MTMRTNTASSRTPKDILLYVLAYLLWLVNVVVCIAAVIQIRSVANVLWVALGYNRWTLGLISQLSVLLGGLAACIYVVFLESYYRRSIGRRVQKPASGDRPLQAQISHQGRIRIAQWSADPRLAVLLRRFGVTTAIPLGLVVASLVVTEIALRSLFLGTT